LATSEHTPWGRVDESGTVFVREGESERAVGQYPDGTPEEALAYFGRKFTELAGQVTLLEQRVRRGTAGAEVAGPIAALKTTLVTANAVGDLASLRRRLDALDGAVEQLVQKLSAEAHEALEQASAKRAGLVAEVEALAAQDPAKVQWKQVSASLDDAFARWQAQQRDGPRLPKAEGNELWRRFRAARTVIETNRKAFFAQLDAEHKQAREAKQRLVERAQALVPDGVAGIPAYRGLLDEWKQAGRAGKKFDDALWTRFKAAGDSIYAAKSEQDAKDEQELQANLERKLSLLTEAEPLTSATDHVEARKALLAIQTRWDQIGKVPRDKARSIEDRLRRVEAAVHKLGEDQWQQTNPERKARSEGLASQLHDAIAKLERELAAAEQQGDPKRIAQAREALEARRVWLGALGG
jgi:hypothetical protein